MHFKLAFLYRVLGIGVQDLVAHLACGSLVFVSLQFGLTEIALYSIVLAFLKYGAFRTPQTLVSSLGLLRLWSPAVTSEVFRTNFTFFSFRLIHEKTTWTGDRSSGSLLSWGSDDNGSSFATQVRLADITVGGSV